MNFERTAGPVLEAREGTKTYWTGTVAVPALRGIDRGRPGGVRRGHPAVGLGHDDPPQLPSGLDDIDGGAQAARAARIRPAVALRATD